MFPVRYTRVIGNKGMLYQSMLGVVDPEEALTQLKLYRYCCRQMLLSHKGAGSRQAPPHPHAMLQWRRYEEALMALPSLLGLETDDIVWQTVGSDRVLQMRQEPGKSEDQLKLPRMVKPGPDTVGGYLLVGAKSSQRSVPWTKRTALWLPRLARSKKIHSSISVQTEMGCVAMRLRQPKRGGPDPIVVEWSSRNGVATPPVYRAASWAISSASLGGLATKRCR